MSTLRPTRPLGLAVAALLVAACSSSSDAAPDGGTYTAEDGGGAADVGVVKSVDAFSLDEAGASSTCKALEAYAKCNTSDPCAAIAAKDCIDLDGIYSLTGRKALSSCYSAPGVCDADAGTDVAACLVQAAIAATPDSAAKKLASDFCAACPTDGSSCVSDFFSDVADDAGNIGLGATLELALISDATLGMIDTMCVAGLKGGADDCGFSFAQCAGPLIDPGQCSDMTTGGDDAGNDADPGGA